MIMNKKVSTIFAMAALMGGSLFSNAYAVENVSQSDVISSSTIGSNDDLTSKQMFLKFGNDVIGSKWNADESEIEYLVWDNTAEVAKEDLSQYLWKVQQSQLPGGDYVYTFTNVATGQPITFQKQDANGKYDKDNGTYQLVRKKSVEGKTETLFYAGSDAAEEWDGTLATNETIELAAEDNSVLYFDNANDGFALGTTTENESFALNALNPGITVTDPDALNDLYNSAGFNFELNDSDLSGVSNLFEEKTIVAINVTSDVTEKTGYAFPEGTYFATSTPGKWNPLKSNSWKLDYLLKCTFVAVDSDVNIAEEADDRKAGNGFTLTEVSGRDLVLYTDTDNDYKAAGNQISVYNACFTVEESTTEEDVYALSLGTVRAVEASSANTQKDYSDVYLTANEDASGVNTIVGQTSPVFKFKFAESTVVKASTFLFKGDTAAIYNIRFYKSNGNDNTENGKYLTTSATGDAFQAKGLVIADLDVPAYQWVISGVDGNDVTFTNRETGINLITKLFDEGNDRYSLAFESASNGKTQYNYYNVNQEGDVVVGEKADGTIDTKNLQGAYVELIPVKAATYAGYLNVDDKTVMTLSFGRDIAPTSNKLYPVYDETKPTGFADEMTGNVTEAAQWRLIKSTTDNHPVRYNYVYANGDLINTKTQGDVVYAYTYKLQLINNGKVENLYLGKAGDRLVPEADAGNFYIQENVDGSVYIKAFTSNAGTRKEGKALLLNNFQREDFSINGLKNEDFAIQDMGTQLTILSEADQVKTFLIEEAPAISLPANEGHYSFVSDLGNYITMNEERDGLTVKEEAEPMYLYVTDKEEVVPAFYITKTAGANTNERMFLFNPTDSVTYYVADGAYDKVYQLPGKQTKAIFKAAAINETRDTLTTSIKGESTLVAIDANNTQKVEGGLDRFKVQIVESTTDPDMYVVRQSNSEDGMVWLSAVNGMLTWGAQDDAMLFDITRTEAPTANEGVSATEVKVIATDGAINIKNAAGKNVVISTILGQIVANEVLTSDNATISVPAGIAIVSVDGEEAVKVSVK